ncbi:hypothetical protein Syun_028232 [Stephania yunnanensis]|uniref:Protein kinase domain-containing protein n=1 Tax=Stephania yunnanensis TaxID=152371 RepID=A0AAP0EGZ0_9MAGN
MRQALEARLVVVEEIRKVVEQEKLDKEESIDLRSISLDWAMRRDIILGIARGVLYLHQDSRLRIVHRDLKASWMSLRSMNTMNL